jgi:hypothetical protein
VELSRPLDFIGLALAGLASGPIFPSLIATTPARLGEAHGANAVGFEVAAAALGQALLPGLIGLLAGWLGAGIVAPALLATAITLLSLHRPLFGPSPLSWRRSIRFRHVRVCTAGAERRVG